ncbi:MAG: hypothetical protein ACKO96_42145, partial [Flammeovirgaceae bacterium]
MSKVPQSNDLTISKIDRNELEISYTFPNKFTIKDADGNTYLFEPLEQTKTKSVTPSTWYELWYTSSYYLTKIILNNKREMLFKYEEEVTIEYEFQRSQRYIDGSLRAVENSPIAYVSPSTHQTVYTRLLTGISSDNANINFHYNLEREDLRGDRALTSVDVYNFDNTLIKKIDLEYEFVSADVCPSGVSSYTCKRLFLKSIKETNGDESLPPYKFEYDQTSLPQRNSFEQDDWGFFNDSNAISGIPKIFVYPTSSRAGERYLTFPKPGSSTSIILDGADKSVNPLKVQAGILKKITYPTGGTMSVEYESNQFLWFSEASSNVQDAYNITGGGVRVKRMTL